MRAAPRSRSALSLAGAEPLRAFRQALAMPAARSCASLALSRLTNHLGACAERGAVMHYTPPPSPFRVTAPDACASRQVRQHPTIAERGHPSTAQIGRAHV